MEDNLDVSSGLAHSREAVALRSSGVAGNPYLTGGILMGTSLLGLVVIIWAFWYQRNNLSVFKRTCMTSFFFRSTSIQVVYSSLVSLLIMDALNLITAIIFGAEMIRSSCGDVMNCTYVEIVWSLSRWFGVINHLVLASLSIHYLCQPQGGTGYRCVNSLNIFMIVILIPLFLYVAHVAIFVLAAFIFLLALAVIVRSPASTLSPSTVHLKKLIVVVAMCTLVVVYVPPFILQCLIYSTNDEYKLNSYNIVYANVLVFTNCHLIFDGLQCALTLKLPSGEEEQQQQQQHQLPQWQQQPQQQWQQQQQQWQQQWQRQQQQWQQQQWQQPQQQQWQQQQWQQQQQLGFRNQGFTMSTNVNQ